MNETPETPDPDETSPDDAPGGDPPETEAPSDEDVERSALYEEATREADRHKWIESEKAGRDLGDVAIRDWHKNYWRSWARERWIEHLRGERFWIELDRDDYGLLEKQLADRGPLADAVIERIQAGGENLDIIQWAGEEGYDIDEVLEVLRILDINARRLSPAVTVDPQEETPQRTGPIRILVIDDDEVTREMLRELFEGEGLECITAATGEDGIEFAQQKRFQAFMVDIMLPGKHGAEVAWWLRRHGVNVPVIAISAVFDNWNPDDLYDCGFTGLMGKPFDIRELRQFASDIKRDNMRGPDGEPRE